MEGVIVETSKKRGEPDTGLSPDGSAQLSLKKTRVDEALNLSIFVKGKTDNISSLAKNKPLFFKRELNSNIGDVEKVDFVGTSLRIQCKSINQKREALKMRQIGGKEITVTEPFTLQQHVTKSTKTRTDTIKGIIFGVGLEETDEDLTNALDAIWARRQKRRENGDLVDTMTVVFEIQGTTLPEHVSIGYTQKKVKKFVSNPFRCHSCQIFGHKENECNSQPRCAQCGSQKHKYAQCPNMATPFCINCKGNHNAAYRGCPRYIEVQNALITVSKDNISYSAALTKNKEIIAQTIVLDVDQGHTAVAESQFIVHDIDDETEYPALGLNQQFAAHARTVQQQRTGQSRYLQHSAAASSYQQQPTMFSSYSQAYNRPTANNDTATREIDIDSITDEVFRRIGDKFMIRLESFMQHIILLLVTANLDPSLINKVKEVAKKFQTASSAEQNIIS